MVYYYFRLIAWLDRLTDFIEWFCIFEQLNYNGVTHIILILLDSMNLVQVEVNKLNFTFLEMLDKVLQPLCNHML